MIHLHLIGYTADLDHLVLDLDDEEGRGRYRLVVDGDLFATLDEVRDQRRAAGKDAGVWPPAGYVSIAELDAYLEDASHEASAPDEDEPDEVGSGWTEPAEPVAPRGVRPDAPPVSELEDDLYAEVEDEAGDAVEDEPGGAVDDDADDEEPPAVRVVTSGARRDDELESRSRLLFDDDDDDEWEDLVVDAGEPPLLEPSAPPQDEPGPAVPRAAALPDRRTPPAPLPAEPKLSPAEIQARLRAGKSPRSVAKAAGTDVAWIERWLPPILAERHRVLERARGMRLERARLGASRDPLGAAVERNLRERDVDLEDVSWDVGRRQDGRWRVSVRFTHRGRARSATWLLDLDGEVLSAASELARDLGFTRSRTAGRSSQARS